MLVVSMIPIRSLDLNLMSDPFIDLDSYIYTGKVSVTLCDTNVDLVDFVEAAEELLFQQLVPSIEAHLVDMYLKQPQSVKLLESITRLIELKKGISYNDVFFFSDRCRCFKECLIPYTPCFRYSGRFELYSITI